LCRKVMEGLVALHEDGCSPIFIQQMVYSRAEHGARGKGKFLTLKLAGSTEGLGGSLGGPLDTSLLLPAAFMTMVLIFLHTFWGFLFFHSCGHRRWWDITAVVMRLTILGLTFCNPLYVGSLVLSYLPMATGATWAYLLSGGSAQNLQCFQFCK
ncbi:Gamma-secretase subunit Aph-1b, partial [Merops nubicus]